jgi:hypothetical protein
VTARSRSGAADETFAFASTSWPAAIRIDGGDGVNTLDYTAAGEGVAVNLPLGTATGLTGGIAKIRAVVGSAFDDILVGSGGNVLAGGDGRDLLVAGASPSSLFGGAGDDLLIAGTTKYDRDPSALEAVRAEWTAAGAYEARTTALLNGWLAAGSVTSNGGGNVPLGGADRDLFFGLFVGDPFDDLEPGEIVVPI